MTESCGVLETCNGKQIKEISSDHILRSFLILCFWLFEKKMLSLNTVHPLMMFLYDRNVPGL
jgi:hypothetical protein